MTILLEPTTTPIQTFADVWEELGLVPLDRILMHPAPGTATEADVLTLLEAADKKLCELVDGVLIEKTMGFQESVLAGIIIHLLHDYLLEHKSGIVSGADGPLRLKLGLVRLPDVAFISWDRFPDRLLPTQPIADLAPDLAIEVLSKNNTAKEMDRKLKDYFRAGVRLVWYIDPETRTARAFRSVDEFTAHAEDQPLDASPVLPGFNLSLKELFARAAAPDQTKDQQP